MGSQRCRVAIAEPNCIVTNEQPDAIGFKGSYSILKRVWGIADTTSVSRGSSQKMTCRNGGDYCMSSLADGFG
mgnify:CR=1 FL=1